MKLFKSTLLATIIITITLLQGCVSQKTPPSIIHADNYTAETLKSQQVTPPADRVLGMEEAIRIGLTNNPTYKQKRLAIISAWSTFYKELAAYSPELKVTFEGTQNQWTGSAGGVNSILNTKYAGNLATSWNLFKGLQTTMDSLSARADALSTEELEKNYRRTLIYGITQAYNKILLNRAQIEIDLSDEAYQEQQVRDEQLKYNAGASSLSDLLNFQIGKATAQDKVIEDTALYKVNRYALAQLMGLTTADLPEETQFPPIRFEDSEEYSLGVEFYLDMAISQRPDLKSTKLDLEALKYTLYSKWGAFSPTLDATMNYGYDTTLNNSHQGRGVPRGNDLNFNYGFTASWDLWKGGSRIADVRYAQAKLDSQQEELMITWIDIVKDVRTAYTHLLSDIAHTQLRHQILQYAQKRRDLVREEFNAGNIDIATLNQAQNTLVESESKHVQSVIAVSDSKAELYAACGANVLN